MNYPGKELENFDQANYWRYYIYLHLKKFLKKEILEVGAGIGSFTKNYIHRSKKITLTETDNKNFLYLKKIFRKKKIKVLKKKTKHLFKKYNVIMYLNVIEHIKQDKLELKIALSKIKKDGYLIILVPAHNNLYSKFDRAIGHFRRYEMSFFKKINFKNTKKIKLCFLDSSGYFLYYLNKLFFKSETYPSKLKIFIWDKFFTPITYILDALLLYKFGKNILYIIKKTK